MQQVAGIAILLLMGICILGLIDVAKQISKLD
jgi:hypothetical protein